MLALALLMFETQKKVPQITVSDIVDVWQSHFYSSAPPQLLTFRADGTFSAPKYSGTWRIVEDHLLMRSEGSESDEKPLWLFGEGDRISDNIPDGTTYFRYSTRLVEENVIGLWSKKPDPQPGPPTKETVVISGINQFRMGTNKRSLKVVRGHVEFEVDGKAVQLWPNADYSQFSEKAAAGFSLYRLPQEPLDKSILGEWSCYRTSSDDERIPLLLKQDHTYTLGKKEGKWRVNDSAIEFTNFRGSTVLFEPPKNNGMYMRNKGTRTYALLRE